MHRGDGEVDAGLMAVLEVAEREQGSGIVDGVSS